MKKFVAVIFSFLLISCGLEHNKVDDAVAICWEAQQTDKNPTIDFDKAFDFEWDSLCFYSVGCSLEDINRDLGFPLTEYTDLADRMVFLYHGKPAYITGWWYNTEKPSGTTIGCNGSVFKTDRKHAKFKIQKRGNLYILWPQQR